MKKNLLDYNFPQDLKGMSIEDVELLSYSIKMEIIFGLSFLKIEISENNDCNKINMLYFITLLLFNY